MSDYFGVFVKQTLARLGEPLSDDVPKGVKSVCVHAEMNETMKKSVIIYVFIYF